MGRQGDHGDGGDLGHGKIKGFHGGNHPILVGEQPGDDGNDGIPWQFEYRHGWLEQPFQPGHDGRIFNQNHQEINGNHDLQKHDSGLEAFDGSVLNSNQKS